MAKKAQLPTDNKKTKAPAKKSAPKKAAAKKVEVTPKHTVKPMPNREGMFCIYVDGKQTDFVNTKDRCQTQADFLNGK